MNRTTFLVDGFNLYHSLKEATRDLGGAGTRWLDLRSLCSSFLYLVGGNASLASVHYFSALATHLETVKPGVTGRHLAYIRCLRERGIDVELGEFKERRSMCPHCGQQIVRHEEKQTDVAIACRLLERFGRDRCDAVVLVTGDSDLAAAVREARKWFPDRDVLCGFPYRRESHELRSIATSTFRIRRERYLQHQLPDPVNLPDGTLVHRPREW